MKDNELIAISQRDVSGYYPHLNNVKDQLPTELANFFTSKLSNKFSVKNYTFDVYRSGQATYQLIDINPFCDMTDPLLFNWPELRDHTKVHMYSDFIIMYTLSMDC